MILKVKMCILLNMNEEDIIVMKEKVRLQINQNTKEYSISARCQNFLLLFLLELVL